MNIITDCELFSNEKNSANLLIRILTVNKNFVFLMTLSLMVIANKVNNHS